MRFMGDQTNLVRYRNDGDEFHVLWTARRAMRLLDASSGLKLVTIEGVTEDDKQAGVAGLLVVDTAEYYGANTLAGAQRVIYNQLKYSTRTPDEPWSASGLSDTFKGFADLYKARVQDLGSEQTSRKITFSFVTNRPFSENIQHALDAARAGKTAADLEGQVRGAFETLFDPTGLTGTDLRNFASLVELAGGAYSLDGQSHQLVVDIKHVTPELDTGCIAKMKDLIRQKALSKASEENGIDINELLFIFDMGNESELLPCPPRFEPLMNTVRRAQEQAIVQKVLSSQWPTIIQAGGGEGKSVLARRLGEHLPAGSEVVVFDGFAGGSYRDPRGYRHQHFAGLVQIANELAQRSLCNILIKGHAVPAKSYLDAFYGRLEQAAAAVRARSPDAVVMVVIDAADNLGMVAADVNESCFAPDLLLEQAPEGCRIVVLARTNRVDEFLKPHHEVARVNLGVFTEPETAVLLRQRFPGATGHDAHEFHRLTYGNPRVQANALAMAEDVAGLLAAQTFGVTDTQSLIEGQLEKALAKLKHDHAATDDEFLPLCLPLAALPPPVPIGVLATASAMNEVAIRGFITDFAGGRPITLVGTDAVQFRDEPVETWFHNKFVSTPEQYGKIVDLMKPMTMSNAYVATMLPLLLDAAERYDELMQLALTGGLPESADPVQKREMVLNRVQYALRAALSRDNLIDATKLALRAGEELAATGRQTQFLMDNGDIVSALAGPSVVMDFVLRNRAWTADRKAYIYCALMLATTGEAATEARRFLALSRLWLKDWVTDRKRKIAAGREHFVERLEPEFIASLAEAILRLEGPAEMAEFIGGWTEWFAYKAMSTVARRVLDRGETDVLLKVLRAELEDGSIPCSLAVVLELHRVGHAIPKREVSALVRGLLAGDKPADLEYHESAPVLAVVATAEAAARQGVPRGQLVQLLKRYPQPHQYKHRDYNTAEREAVIRGAALLAELEGRKLDFEDIWSNDVRVAREKAAQEYAENIKRLQAEGIKPRTDGPAMTDEEKDFREMYGSLMPWCVLRARAVLGRVTDWEKEVETAHNETKVEKWKWRHQHELSGVLNDLGQTWMDALFWAGQANTDSAAAVAGWLADQDAYIRKPTWIKMARRVAQAGASFHDASLALATRAREMQEADKEEARYAADTYTDLARAVMPVDRLEAQELFQEALTKLDRLGDELYDRMQALLSLADGASTDGSTDAREAYRVARMGELFHSYNDHKFPWYDVINSVANLSPATALAVIARLHDRDVGYIGYMLPGVVKQLLEKDLITPSTLAALHALDDGWDLEDEAAHLFPAGAAAAVNKSVLDTLLDDYRKRSYPGRATLDAFAAATVRQGLDTSSLNAVRAYLGEQPDPYASSHDYVKEKSQETFTASDWAELMEGLDLHTASGIDVAQTKRSAPGVPYDPDAFMAGMRSRIESTRRSEHVKALVRSEGLTIDMIVGGLEACNREWGVNSLAVKREVVASTKYLLETRAVEVLAHSWDFQKLMDRCGVLAEQSKKDMFTLLLRSLGENIHDVSARSLFFLVQVLSNKLLTPTQSMDALRYGLDRVDLVTDDDDGDGSWRAELDPDPDMAKALARFLYAMLADPAMAFRWRAAHAVRRLCRSGETRIVAELVALLPSTSLPAYRDHRLPFYEMHARLYLLIAFARAALESPEVLLPHAKSFLDAALTGPPHVLIRRFAADIALALEVFRSGTYSQQEVDSLRAVNKSAYPVISAKDDHDAGDEQPAAEDVDTRFTFDYDFDRYWLEPLGDVFGIRAKDVERKGETWVIDRWKQAGKDNWKSEPRFKSDYSQRDTYASHGSYPKKDRFAFYLSYHAMFCVAGELLAERPVVVRYERNPWEHWVSGHALTRSDGKWIADRMSPPPLASREWEVKAFDYAQHDEWRFSVIADDLDSAIGFRGTETASLMVYGHVTVVSSSRIETTYVQSALVDPQASMALLRALQTVDDQHSYRLPLEKDEWERSSAPFRMCGWLRDIDTERELDRFDELAGDAPYPGPMSGKRLRRLFGLRPDDEQRVWRQGASVAMRSETWGDWRSEDHGRKHSHGEMVTITPEFLRTVLARLKRDLVLKVEVTRSHDERETFDAEAYKYRGYTRIYIFGSDGSVHTLPGHRRLW